MKKIDVIEEAKLRWPDGCERTRIKERTGCGRWREGWGDTKKRLTQELERLGATSVLITRHENEKDPGVAVWFSRTREDFSWQQGLGLDNPAPTLDEIDSAFRIRAKKVHPDNVGGGDPVATWEGHKAAQPDNMLVIMFRALEGSVAR